jgi:hypothetical protein
MVTPSVALRYRTDEVPIKSDIINNESTYATVMPCPRFIPSVAINKVIEKFAIK